MGQRELLGCWLLLEESSWLNVKSLLSMDRILNRLSRNPEWLSQSSELRRSSDPTTWQQPPRHGLRLMTLRWGRPPARQHGRLSSTTKWRLHSKPEMLGDGPMWRPAEPSSLPRLPGSGPDDLMVLLCAPSWKSTPLWRFHSRPGATIGGLTQLPTVPSNRLGLLLDLLLWKATQHSLPGLLLAPQPQAAQWCGLLRLPRATPAETTQAGRRETRPSPTQGTGGGSSLTQCQLSKQWSWTRMPRLQCWELGCYAIPVCPGRRARSVT